MRTTDGKLGTIKMGWRVAAGAGIWCVVSAVSGAASAQALAIKPDALLSIDLNRETVVEKIAASWAKEIPAAQIESFKAKLAGLRADQLLAANLAGSFDGVLEVLSDADDTRQSALNQSRLIITAAVAQQRGIRNSHDLAQLHTQLHTQLKAQRPPQSQPQALDKSKAVGDPTIDLVYTPIAPCNLMDTRPGVSPAPPEGGPALNAGYGIRIVQVTGRCGIPAGAKAVASLFTVENIPSTGGVVFAGDAGGAGGAVASWSTPANYASGSSLVPLSAAGAMQLQSAGATQIKIDVNGYFMPANRNGDGLRVIGAGTANAVSVVNGESNNTVGTAVGATISGGVSNTATGNNATIGGGGGNRATGDGSTVGGGGLSAASNCHDHVTNTATAPCWNEATGLTSTVSGGYNNRSSGYGAAIGGGAQNRATSTNSVVGGGVNNDATNYNSVVAGGSWNEVSGFNSGVLGGFLNKVAGNQSAIVGGSGGIVAGTNSFMGSGGAGPASTCYNHVTGVSDELCRNEIAATAGSAVIGGGHNNKTSNAWTFIGGGASNTIAQNDSAIVGGWANTINAQGFNAFIGAGNRNTNGGNAAAMVGGSINSISDLAPEAFIGGGRSNSATGARAVIVGGLTNTASGREAAVVAGSNNGATGERAFVGGGQGNTASGIRSVVAGGNLNTASADRATVSGGSVNSASGIYATVPGGWANQATGAFSFAAGQQALTNDGATTPTHFYGAFIWADSPDALPGTTSSQPFHSTANNQFAVRARGGVTFKVDATTIAANASDATAGCSLPSGGAASWSCSSDRNLKDGIKAISPKDVLSKVVNLPLSTWQFKGTSRRHLSPMAQDFWAAFGFGEDDRHITASDVSGVALAAVQGVNQKMNDELTALKAKNAQLARSNEAMQRSSTAMQRELAAIKKKLGL